MDENKTKKESKSSAVREGVGELASLASSLASPAIKALGPSVKRYWSERTHKSNDKQLSGITNPLTYTPLPRASCIRLLTIWPGEIADILYCTLRVVDLEDHPNFIALSYTWSQDASWTSTSYNLLREAWSGGQGSDPLAHSLVDQPDETKKRIICNHQVAEIQPNLYNCLLHLRQARPGDSGLMQYA
ncbi:hypothetical protein F5Y18DRAFT_191235 [Xylariaceae sp. FL1019]|nr:hypothetical protein F5Y18DRAFT_191235 [Xylariaceae sp. FL1019]